MKVLEVGISVIFGEEGWASDWDRGGKWFSDIILFMKSCWCYIVVQNTEIPNPKFCVDTEIPKNAKV